MNWSEQRQVSGATNSSNGASSDLWGNSLYLALYKDVLLRIEKLRFSLGRELAEAAEEAISGGCINNASKEGDMPYIRLIIPVIFPRVVNLVEKS